MPLPYTYRKIQNWILLLTTTLLLSGIQSQADSIIQIEIASNVAYNYHLDTLTGYRTDRYSMLLTYDVDSKTYKSDTFLQYDKIAFRNSDFEFYTYTENYHPFRIKWSVEASEIDYLLWDISDRESYNLHKFTDAIKVKDSTEIITHNELLVLDDIDFSCLLIDTNKFINLIRLNDHWQETANNKSADDLIASYFNHWLYLNSLDIVISYEHNLVVRLLLGSGEIIELFQYHPGTYNCKWRIRTKDDEFTVFNPYLNETIAAAMDGRFGSRKRDLTEYRSSLYFLGELR